MINRLYVAELSESTLKLTTMLSGLHDVLEPSVNDWGGELVAGIANGSTVLGMPATRSG
jgi:hypothetical protein